MEDLGYGSGRLTGRLGIITQRSMVQIHAPLPLKPETFWFPVFCFPQDVSLLLYKVPIHIERNRHTQRMVMPPQPS